MYGLLGEFPTEYIARDVKLPGAHILKLQGYDEVPYKGVEKAVLWDVKDSPIINKYYRTLRVLRRASRSLLAWNPWKAMSFENLYNRMMQDWDKAFMGYYNDQRNQQWWNGLKFEPHEADFIDNQIQWQGMSHFIKLGAGLTSQFIDWLAVGTALNAPSIIPSNRQTLYQEKARESASATGAITADGNTLRMSASFAPNMPTADIKEYGGFTQQTGGIMFFIAVGNKILKHIQGETRIQMTHYVIFTSKVIQQ